MSGIWKILKHYEPVLLQNSTYRLCSYLLMIEAEKFSVIHKRKQQNLEGDRFIKNLTFYLRSQGTRITRHGN